MKRLIAAVLLFGVVGAYAQNREAISASDTASVVVGRNRGIVEDPARLPGQHNAVHVVAKHPKAGCADTAVCGTVFYDVSNTNLVVNAGLNWLADIMSNTSTPSVNLQCNYFAVTPTAISPGATDVALSGEITNNGFNSTGGAGSGVRAQATYAHSANATTYTLTKTYTATGAQTVAGAAVFTASSSTTMCFEDALTSASLQTNDTLAITWTITI